MTHASDAHNIFCHCVKKSKKSVGKFSIMQPVHVYPISPETGCARIYFKFSGLTKTHRLMLHNQSLIKQADIIWLLCYKNKTKYFVLRQYD